MSGFQRTLGLKATIAIVIGGVIGSGIFMKPALMASQLGSPLLLLSVWLVAGLVSMFGALSNCELATMFPETGGPYVFFKKIYGNVFAFTYAWAAFAVINTAGNASIAYVCSQYTNYFIELPRFANATEHLWQLNIPAVGTIFPLENIGVKCLTVILVWILSWVNIRSVNYGAGLQNVLTLMKALAIFLLIGGIFFAHNGSVQNIVTSSEDMPSGWALIGAYMAAISGAFWAYDGWNNITFVAGEIKDPQKNIPKALFGGLFFCILVYALINLAYCYALPINTMASSSFVASDAASVSWGVIGAGFIALLVILSTLGAANSNILATARTTYAMGADSKWFSAAEKIHPKFNTPKNALVFNGVWSTILIFSGSFDVLTDMLVFVTWFFYGMSSLGVIILRFKMKEAERPYKVWLYPFIPILFIAFVLFFLCTTVYTDIINYQNNSSLIINSVLGILITLLGIPVYFFSKNKINR
jgi:APA family basic amino acid/polyamine antiporter